MTGRFEHFDKRPGGSYRLALSYADASAARGTSAVDSDVVDARFVEIVPDEGVTAALREEGQGQRVAGLGLLLGPGAIGAPSGKRRDFFTTVVM